MAMIEQHMEIRRPQGDTEYIAAIQDRFAELYVTDTELHGEEGKVITAGCVHRLWRDVIAEGYGR